MIDVKKFKKGTKVLISTVIIGSIIMSGSAISPSSISASQIMQVKVSTIKNIDTIINDKKQAFTPSSVLKDGTAMVPVSHVFK